jgi:hypothetical protein
MPNTSMSGQIEWLDLKQRRKNRSAERFNPKGKYDTDFISLPDFFAVRFRAKLLSHARTPDAKIRE